MELQQLRYFLEAARTEHLTQSARRLGIAQPALSQSIGRLEAELGTALFERSGRNVKLTGAGALVRDRVEPLMKGLDGLPSAIGELADAENRTVRVSLLAASAVGIDAIAAYRKTRPRTRFSINQSRMPFESDIVIDGLAFHAKEKRAAKTPPDDDAHRSFTERIAIAAATASPLASDGISLADLADADFICLAAPHRFRAVCDALCLKHDFAPRISFESDNPSVVRKMIGLDLGIGFWPEKTWRSELAGGVRLIPIDEPGFTRTTTLSLVPHEQPHEEARRFFGFLTEFFSKAYGTGTQHGERE